MQSHRLYALRAVKWPCPLDQSFYIWDSSLKKTPNMGILYDSPQFSMDSYWLPRARHTAPPVPGLCTHCPTHTRPLAQHLPQHVTSIFSSSFWPRTAQPVPTPCSEKSPRPLVLYLLRNSQDWPCARCLSPSFLLGSEAGPAFTPTMNTGCRRVALHAGYSLGFSWAPGCSVDPTPHQGG